MSANAPFKQPSNRVSQFSKTPSANISRSKFNLSHTHKGTITDAGLLHPIGLYECYPGDTFTIKPTVFVRMTTQFYPVMDNAYLDLFVFYVPNRLVWTNWPRFMGERTPDPDSSIDFTVPVLSHQSAQGVTEGTLLDAYGIPCGINTDATGNALQINAMPLRGYNRIWNEWFRSEVLQDSVVSETDDGPDLYADYNTILRRGKRHDYFTSAAPTPQKGTAVPLPLGTTAPVLGLGKGNNTWATPDQTVYESDGSTQLYDTSQVINPGSADGQFYIEQGGTARGGTATYPFIFADLSDATASTVNDIREAFQIQRILERDMRGGTRMFELIQSHFGVVDPSALIPTRPVFIGGSSTPFNQQTVAQTTFQGTETRFDAKGALAANSVFVSNFPGVTYSMTEWGYIHVLASIRCDITYQQGIDRHWLRSTRYDYYLPTLAHLGEQVVESREIYYDSSGSSTALTGDWSVFGYIPRFDELRFGKSLITGMMKSNTFSGTTLDFMHFAQDFATRPTLSDTFIQDTPPIARVVNITPTATTPAFMFDAFMQVFAVRPMPSQGTPGMIDHF